MANQKLSKLVLPGSSNVYEIDAVYFGGKTAAEWQASTMSFKGTVSPSGTTATINFTTVDSSKKFYSMPSGTYTAGDAYKVVFNPTSEVGDLYEQSGVTSSTSSVGKYAISHGDMIIYSAENKWVLIPSGNDEQVGTVTSIATGYGLTGGPITDSGEISVDTAAIAKVAHTHNVTINHTHDHTFTGKPVDTILKTTAKGSITVADDSNGQYTPAGTISQPTFSGTTTTHGHSFTGTKATITVPQASSITVGNHTISTVDDASATFTGTKATITSGFTPAGTISSAFTGTEAIFHAAFTGTPKNISAAYTPKGSISSETSSSGNYTPQGSVSSTFTGTEANLSLAYTPAGGITLVSKATETSGYLKYTPAGSVSSTFTGIEKNISAVYTPEGTVSAPTITVTAGNVNYIKTVTTPDTNKTSVVSDVTFATHNYDATEKKLTLTFDLTKATVLTGVTTTSDKPTVTATASAPTFTGTAGIATGKYTPEGTVSSIWTGTPIWFNGNFSGTAGTATGKYTPEGSISNTFSGTKVKLTFTGEAGDATGTYTPEGSVALTKVGTAATGDLAYTPAGTVSSTFSGTAGTATGEYTPEGSVAVELTRSNKTLTHTGLSVKNDGSASIDYTPDGTVSDVAAMTVTGTVSRPTFSGTKVKFTFNGEEVNATGKVTADGTVNEKTISSTLTTTEATNK